MFKKTDPYSFTKFSNLEAPDPSAPTGPYQNIGSMISVFQISSIEDIQFCDATAISKRTSKKYLLEITQRIKIINPNGANIAPYIQDPYVYKNYPVLIDAGLSITPSQGLNFQLMDYSPQTINTKVQNSGSNADSNGGSTGSSTSNTVGSTTSQTNSYGGSISLEGGSANYEHSSTYTQEQSNTAGTEVSKNRNNETSSTDSMSLKDWGSYAWLDPASGAPSWRFGQEYPWDAIQHNKVPLNQVSGAPNPNQVQILVPDSEAIRLLTTASLSGSNMGAGMLNPPSQLSMFGVNFVMKASWIVNIDDSFSSTINVNQNLSYFTASHFTHFDGSENPPMAAIFMDSKALPVRAKAPDTLGVSLNVPLMSLDPLEMMNKAAIVGFAQNKFNVFPQPNVPFSITSVGNNLQVSDTTSLNPKNHYAFSCKDNTGIESTLDQDKQPIMFNLYFKVVDIENDYILYMKHWKINSPGVELNFVINGDNSNSITKYVDSKEGEGAEKNLLGIHLRNQDYSSVDYHDYLQLGLNSVQITMTPIGGTYSADCVYHLRAISIEKS